MYWIGSKTKIIAAEKNATGLVVGLPEFRDGVELPPEEWVTSRWAIPEQDKNGNWFILAHPDMELPDGCELVDSVELL